MAPKKTPKKRIIATYFPDETIAEKRIARLDDILAELATLTSTVQRLEERVTQLENDED
jgi:ubiquinone biosynthesis protein UbiJ